VAFLLNTNTTIIGNTHDTDLLEKNQINTLPNKINWARGGERALAELPRATGSRPNPVRIYFYFFIFIFSSRSSCNSREK